MEEYIWPAWAGMVKIDDCRLGFHYGDSKSLLTLDFFEHETNNKWRRTTLTDWSQEPVTNNAFSMLFHSMDVTSAVCSCQACIGNPCHRQISDDLQMTVPWETTRLTSRARSKSLMAPLPQAAAI